MKDICDLVVHLKKKNLWMLMARSGFFGFLTKGQTTLQDRKIMKFIEFPGDA